tara:strand:+ start:95 stop:286 length:192 start_codon:yes stop_codon:yes gene_type:complete
MRIEIGSVQDLVDLSVDGIVDLTDPETGRVVVKGVPISMTIDNMSIASYVWDYLDTENLMEIE